SITQAPLDPALLMNTRCHCEGGLPTAAIQGRARIRWIATPLRSCHYNTRLSLRRRLADCGNPRKGRDQMDRHVAALLAMTGGGRSSLPPFPNGSALVRALAITRKEKVHSQHHASSA